MNSSSLFYLLNRLVLGIFCVFTSSVNATEEIPFPNDHLKVAPLSTAIQELNTGKKDFCFLPLDFSESEKEFLKKLELRLPEKALIGKEFNFYGDISFSQEAKQSKDSAVNKVKDRLESFFGEYTNAQEAGKENGIGDGSRLLSRIVLEFSEKLLDQVNAAQPDQDKINFIYISLKAFNKNDAFLNFLRWHYDGGGRVRPGAADLNFAGVFMGAPTVFAEMTEANRPTLTEKVSGMHDFNNVPSNQYSPSGLIQHLHRYRDEYQEASVEYANLSKEIENVQALDPSNNVEKNNILQRLYKRMELHQFIKDNQLISRVVQPKPYEVSLFTMTGEKPALHSEPHIEVPRIFFGLRVYQETRSEKGVMSLNAGDLADPRSY